jgi:hypothetical protein
VKWPLLESPLKKTLAALLFLAAVSFPSDSFCLTLSELRTQIRIRILDTNSSRQRYTDAQLNALINETHRDVTNFSWVVRKSDDFELSAGTTFYSVQADLLHIDRVTWRRRNIPEATFTSLDSAAEFGDWGLAAGPPQSYFQDPSQPDMIGFYPWPNNSSSTGTVVVYYAAQANSLSSDSDEPFSGEDRYQTWADILIYEPSYKIMLIEGEDTKAGEYKAYSETRLRNMMEKLGLRQNYIPGVAGPNPR